MSVENSLSLQFYKYLCQKIGYEDEVKVRRLTYIMDDLGITRIKVHQVTSGSKGEGLQLNGSDLDKMYINPLFKVYELDRDFVPQSGRFIPLVMNTDDTHSCFTQLHLFNNHDLIFYHREVFKNFFLGRKLSSELYRLSCLKDMSEYDTSAGTGIIKIHGPCISSTTDTLDLAHCLKCDKWISQAHQWIIRPRTTWPPPDLISKIISCGVLYVPIGYKGSTNENLQWRISFSVAEKFLIFSFNHTQLLCYALLKIMIKEIVEKHDDLKTLLCSYFVKTVMFWISEESDPSMWRPDKIIPCFMACLKRLIYSVEYSTLLHYFIPDNNLLYLRFDAVKKHTLTRTLNILYEKGIYSFALSETLSDIMRPPFNATGSSISRHITTLHNTLNTHLHRPINLLYHFLHHANTSTSKSIFLEILTVAHQFVPQTSQNQPRLNNKLKYYKYKRDRSHLLIGTNSDAVSGWLVLASFFYVHKNYLLSLEITNLVLRKCTDEKIYLWQISLDQNQQNLLYLLKRVKLCTLSKAVRVKYLKFINNSPISPQELQLNVCEQFIPFHPMIFAYFLRFLCYFHLHKGRSCQQSLIQLGQAILQQCIIDRSFRYSTPVWLSLICLGIAHQVIGDTYSARQCFLLATQMDERNLTSAAMRLSNCIVD